MKTNSKTGHHENVTNLNVLSTRVATLGEAYKPTNELLTVLNLNATCTNGQSANDAVDAAEVPLKNARSGRVISFNGLDTLTSRSVNALAVSGASEQTIEQAKALARDVHGKRASEILTDEEIAAAKAEGKEARQVIVHNASFSSKITNFGKYNLFISAEPKYNPNEADLKPAALKAKLDDMTAKNAAVLTSETAYNTALDNRNKVLYAENTGLVDIALSAKLYVKSAFGSTSPEYKLISDLVFTKLA